MAATQDRTLSIRQLDTEVLSQHPVAAAGTIYQHTLVGVNAATGYARGLVAGDKFIGLATEKADNSAGAAADISVKLQAGVTVRHAVTGAASDADRDKLVYASADDTLTLTATNNSLVGVVEQWISGTDCFVHLFTPAERAAF